MANTVYVKKPGGLVVPFADGDTRVVAWGDPINLDDITEDARNHISRSTTTKKLKEDPPSPTDTAFSAAMGESTNVNSTASAVPGNYRDLSEDDAIRLVQMVRDPKAQAEIVAFEMVNENRDKVVAAASDDVQDEAKVRRMVEDFEAENLAETPQPKGLPKVESPEKQPEPEQPPVRGTTPPPSS